MNLPRLLLCAALFCAPSFANAAQPLQNSVSVALDAEGQLTGQVYVLIEGEKTPLAGKVSLTSDGETVSSVNTDRNGNFAFEDLAPGIYTAIGVSGDYVGKQVITVGGDKSEYTSLAIPVSQGGDYIYDAYGSVPVDTLSSAPVAGQYYDGYAVDNYSFADYVGSCGTCGSCGGGGRFFNGGSGTRFRRLAIIGGTIGLAVGIRNRDASPDE